MPTLHCTSNNDAEPLQNPGACYTAQYAACLNNLHIPYLAAGQTCHPQATETKTAAAKQEKLEGHEEVAHRGRSTERAACGVLSVCLSVCLSVTRQFTQSIAIKGAHLILQTNLDIIDEQIKTRFNSGNACYRSL